MVMCSRMRSMCFFLLKEIPKSRTGNNARVARWTGWPPICRAAWEWVQFQLNFIRWQFWKSDQFSDSRQWRRWWCDGVLFAQNFKICSLWGNEAGHSSHISCMHNSQRFFVSTLGTSAEDPEEATTTTYGPDNLPELFNGAAYNASVLLSDTERTESFKALASSTNIQVMDFFAGTGNGSCSLKNQYMAMTASAGLWVGMCIPVQTKQVLTEPLYRCHSSCHYLDTPCFKCPPRSWSQAFGGFHQDCLWEGQKMHQAFVQFERGLASVFWIQLQHSQGSRKEHQLHC